jgi:hypothetical protein
MKSANYNSKPKQIIQKVPSVGINKGGKKNNDIGTNIFTFNNLFFGLLISLIWHIIFVIVIKSSVSFQTLGFWILFIFDTLLQAITIIPIIALIRKQIAWFDPVFLLSIIFLSMTAGFLPSYLTDPSYFVSFITFQGVANLGIKNELEFIYTAIFAEIILIIFIVIVYFINRRTIKVSSVRTSILESKYIVLLTLILFLISAYYFTYLWTFQAYLKASTVDIGSYNVKFHGGGSGRYFILSEIGFPSLSLGMIALLITNSIKSKITSIILIGSIVLVSIIPIIYSGSRIYIIECVYIILALIAWFGIKIDWVPWILISTFTLLLVISVTVLRGNRQLSSQPEVVINQLISGEALDLYNKNQSFIIKNTVNIDRVGVVMLVTKYINNGKDLMYGESLVAGVVNTLYQIGAGIGLVNPSVVAPLSEANTRILTWVFGYVNIYSGSLPPSIPGEFYMQGGLIGEVILSILFGWIVLWLRRNCAKSNNLAVRWIFIYMTYRIIFSVSTEASLIASYLVFYLPVWLCIVFATSFFSNFKGRSYV